MVSMFAFIDIDSIWLFRHKVTTMTKLTWADHPLFFLRFPRHTDTIRVIACKRREWICLIRPGSRPFNFIYFLQVKYIKMGDVRFSCIECLGFYLYSLCFSFHLHRWEHLSGSHLRTWLRLYWDRVWNRWFIIKNWVEVQFCGWKVRILVLPTKKWFWRLYRQQLLLSFFLAAVTFWW